MRDKDGKVWEIEKQLDNLEKQTVELFSFRIKSITDYENVSIHRGKFVLTSINDYSKVD